MRTVFGMLTVALASGCAPRVAPEHDRPPTATTDEAGTTDREPDPGDTTGAADPTTGSTAEPDDGSDGSSSTGDEVPPWCITAVDIELAERWAMLADVDGDGHVEIWTATVEGEEVGPFTTRFVSHLFDGQGLEPVTDVVLPGALWGFADVDGDGHDDVVVHDGPELPAGFFRGTAGGGFEEDPLPVTAALPAASDRFADVTADGLADLIHPLLGGSVEVHAGDGGGGFDLTDNFELEGSWSTVELVDDSTLVMLGHSGCEGLCIDNAELATIGIANDGTATVDARTGPAGEMTVIDAVDRNGDGVRDVLAQIQTEHLGPTRIDWFDSTPTGSFAQTTVIDPSNLRNAADFDLDGTVDIIDDDGVRWGLPTIGLSAPQPILEGFPQAGPSQGADLDHDGWMDFVDAFNEVIWTLRPCD